jgi:site-specific DNA recombinase
MNDKQRCIIYTRFSPRRNSEQSESCEFQEAECRKYADARLWDTHLIFEDRAVSGADEDRPGLFGAMEALNKGDVLLIYKPDRLARDVYLNELFRRSVAKQGAKIVCVSGDVEGEGPEQTMIRQIVASLAEYERKLIAARTKAAMRWRQSRGERMSKFPPYGMQFETDPANPKKKILVPNEPEASAVQFIREKTKEGWMMSQIVKHLNESYYRNFARSAGGWNQKTVTKIALAP